MKGQKKHFSLSFLFPLFDFVFIKRIVSRINTLLLRPNIAHFIRASQRFNDRFGQQFSAAITYFSFLSLIPLLMIAFAAGGFLLVSHPTLLGDIINKIANTVSDPTLAETFKKTVVIAVEQRKTVGITGLIIALYSGVNWVGNLREAIWAQFHEEWKYHFKEKKHFLWKLIRDLISLLGLILALILTLSLTSLAGAAQVAVVQALELDGILFLRPIMTLGTLIISTFANFLLFLWIFWFFPYQSVNKKVLFQGTLFAAVGFELLKFLTTFSLPYLVSTPSGAAFGSVLGLLAFFYFFARLILFCAAWIATAEVNQKSTHDEE